MGDNNEGEPGESAGSDSPVLEDLNTTFHGLYDGACGHRKLAAPVIVVLADSLIVFREGQRTERSFRSSSFHDVKSAVHVPIAVFSALASSKDRRPHRPLAPGVGPVLDALRSRASAAGESLQPLPAEVRADADAVLGASVAFVDRTRAEASVSRVALEGFAREVGPRLLRLTEHATRIRLAALHRAVEAELSSMSGEARGVFEVVVAGDHQARARSLPVQYFEKRFGEPPGAERRVTYAEGLNDPAEALALVSKRIFDREIASAFFGDSSKLQRDVLGDAAARLLEQARFDPIGG
jgi:hypothetical protein